MISPFRSRDHSQGEDARRPSRRLLRRISAGGALVLILFFLVIFWILPWLGREGDLNQLVESAIQSILSVPVQIGNIETEPFSEFSITRISSLSTGAENRFEFQAERLTVFYNPLELIFKNRIRELMARGPTLFLNLDENLSGIIQLPPQKPGKESAGYQVDRFRIFNGRLEIRVGGRRLLLEDLELDALGLGGGEKIGFRASGGGLGAGIEAEGFLAPLKGKPGAAERYHIEAARVEIGKLNLEPILDFLSPNGLKGSGLVSLSGKAEGVWPEKIEARLSSSFQNARVARPGAPGLLDGQGRLEVNALAHGRMDQVDFLAHFDAELDVDEGETAPQQSYREGLSLSTRGQFRKNSPEGKGAQVQFDETTLEIPGLGKVVGSGNVELEGPSFSLDLDLPRTSLGDLRRHAIGNSLRQILGPAEGILDLHLHAAGKPGHAELAVLFELQEGALNSGGNPWLFASLEGRTVFQGNLDLEKLARNQNPGLLGGELDIQVSRGSLGIPDLLIEIPDFTAKISSRIAGDPEQELGVRFQAELQAREIGLGSVVEAAWEEPFQAGGEIFIRSGETGKSLRGGFRLETASTGPVDLRGSAAPGPGGVLEFDVEARASSIPNSRFFATVLCEPFREKLAILDGAQFTGRSSMEARLRDSGGKKSLAGVFRTQDLGAQLGEIKLEKTWSEVPFHLGDRQGHTAASGIAGFLQIGGLSYKNLDLGRIWLPFLLSNGTYELSEPALQIPLMGGTLKLERLEFHPTSRGQRLHLVLDARELDLEEITRMLGYPEIPGRMHLQAHSFNMDGDRLDVNGALRLQVFGGRVELQGLSVEHPFTPYHSLSLRSGSVRDLDLGKVGRQFQFGLASGVLEGWLNNLEIQGTELIRFEAGFETAPRPGVSQYINKGAIESIQKIFSGPFHQIEKAFFTKFRYAGFGFTCSLKGDEFRLRGKYNFGGTEYLMYSSWYQFPKVRIINTTPNLVYDWEHIVDNLRSIYGRPKKESLDGGAQ